VGALEEPEEEREVPASQEPEGVAAEPA